MNIKVDIYSNKMILSNGDKTLTVTPNEPYNTSRLIIGKFSVAEACLTRGIKEMGSIGFFKPRPIVSMHQQEILEGGLSEVEQHCLRELALSSGAKEVTVVV